MSKTGYFTHRDCWKHDMGPAHPECPQRLDAIEDRLKLMPGLIAFEQTVAQGSAYVRRRPGQPCGELGFDEVCVVIGARGGRG